MENTHYRGIYDLSEVNIKDFKHIHSNLYKRLKREYGTWNLFEVYKYDNHKLYYLYDECWMKNDK